MLETSSLEELAELLQSKVVHPAEAADLLEDAEPEQVAELLAKVDEDTAADVMEHIDLDVQRQIVDRIPRGHMAKVIEHMAPDARTDLVKGLDEDVVESLLPLIARAERLEIARLASYEEGTAGSVMTTEYAAVNAEHTVAAARDELRRQVAGVDTGYYVFVIDSDRKLVGIVNLRDLLLARPEQKMGDVCRRDFISVNAGDDRESLGEIFSKYEIPSVPVVDDAGRLVGRITADDVIDVVEEEAEEDIYHLGAAGRPIDYLRSSTLRIAFNRITWLLILIATGTLTSMLIRSYENALEAVTALMFFIPLLMGSAGNAGSQTTAVVIRGLATGELELSDVLALIIGGASDPYRFAATVGATMVFVITIAKMLGALLPMLFKKLGLDPALMSAPLITTIVDVLALLIYFNLAIYLLHLAV